MPSLSITNMGHQPFSARQGCSFKHCCHHLVFWAAVVLCMAMPLEANAAAPAATSATGQVNIFAISNDCIACHNSLITPAGIDVSIGSSWQSSMMANSARDPYWQASVRRETLDHPSIAASIEDECAACHMPMTRYLAHTQGGKGKVFAHLPLQAAPTPATLMAADGVSCSVCHQIQADKLGTRESFVAGFVLDSSKPLGQRDIFGPYEVKKGEKRVMSSASGMQPQLSKHVQESALCATCHTLFTHTRGPDGEILGELPEQVPYLEWKHSSFYASKSCQSCHMPQLDEKMEISSVLGQKRENFSRHAFRGGNFLLPQMFNAFRQELGVTTLSQDLTRAAQETLTHLQQSSAKISISEVRRTGSDLSAEVVLENLAGHKLPTAYPSRRAWIRFTLQDARGEVVFSSGAVGADGAIMGNINDQDPRRYEPHYTQIDSAAQVQIYETIMANPAGQVTTGLLEALRYVKDNRLLPQGFDKASASQDIQVQGQARDDRDFTAPGDRVVYRVPLAGHEGPFSVTAELLYQPIGYRWAQNLKQQQAEEIDRFVRYFDALAQNSWTVLAADSRIVE
ncbi:MAG: multiheme c-type cytochrome [Desulfuromonadaceae bacterium]|nr:multiheme c-type cytochrome [Desulfuromonadaceae bacterium]